MNKKYKIGQIINWEEKDKFFWNIKYPKEEHDLINMQLIDERKDSFFNSPFGMFFKNREEIDFENLGNNDIKTMAIWVKRPHNLKVGSEVDLSIEIELGGK